MNTKTDENDREVQDAALLIAVRDFMRLESAGEVLLLGAAILAILMANSPLASIYGGLLDTTVAIQVGTLAINKPLVLWINDGLMAIFFFLIGLEIKREVLEGELSSFSQVVLPGAGALGGMVVPAAIYGWFNWDILFRRSFYHCTLHWDWRNTHCSCNESAQCHEGLGLHHVGDNSLGRCIEVGRSRHTGRCDHCSLHPNAR